jgi:beta-glucosidase
VGGLKHFSFNDQETGRDHANVLIDDRSGRETDLLAFEIGIRDSGAQSVMCSYNLANGAYACENSYLLTTVLKGSWNFPGFVMSDWWATHSTAAAANAGLDQEQPNQTYFGNFGQAVASGQVSQARLDNMIHRILRALFASGVMDHPASMHPVDVAAGDAIAQQTEEQAPCCLRTMERFRSTPRLSPPSPLLDRTPISLSSRAAARRSPKVILALPAGRKWFGTRLRR